MNITKFIIHNKALSGVLAIVICLIGIWTWTELEVVAYPDISDIEVSVITKMTGLPSEEMEMQVTIPIERALNTVPGVISKRSRTIFGLSVVKMTFTDDTDLHLARQLTLEKLRDVELPEGAVSKLGPMTPAIGEIYRYVIEGDESYSLTDLRELQEYIVIPKILQAEGVIDVANFGGLIRQYQIVVDPIQLEKYGLSVSDLAEAIRSNNNNTGGSFIVLGSSQMNIRGVGRISMLSDIENIVIDNRNGVPILIKDLSSVEIASMPPTGILGYLDKARNVSRDFGIEGIVLLRKGANPNVTIENVKKAIHEINSGMLPANVRLEPIYDRTDLLEMTITTVVKTLVEGSIVVFLILTFLLGSWKASVISSISIPFSLLFAFICMYIAGIPANLLSLGAIDFGIIVDASIVMVEGIFRNLQVEHKESSNLDQTVINASKEVQRQIIFAVAIIILSLLPILSLQRVEGRLFAPMAWTLSFAILGSMIYSITLVPLLSSIFFKQGKIHSDIKLWSYVETVYKNEIHALLKRPKRVLIISIGFILSAYSLLPWIGTEFLPDLDEGSIWLKISLPSGISLQAAKVYPDKIRSSLKKHPEIKTILTQLGRNDDGTDPYGPNRLEVLLELVKPYSKWESGLTKKELTEIIKEELDSIIPGASYTVTQPIIDTTIENATGSSGNLAIFLSGRNLDVLRNTAKAILDVVKTTRGSTESAIEQENKQSQLVVRIDRSKAARYGINVEDIDKILNMAIGGFAVSSLYEDEKKFDIVLRFTAESRGTPNNIGKILIQSKLGLRIPLSQVADILMEEGETIIFRENSNRQMIVKTNIKGRDQGSFAKEVGNRILKEVPIPDSVTYYLGGQFENLNRASKRMLLIVPLTLVTVYLVLLLFFKNHHKESLVVMANIPLAVAGGIFALFMRNMNFSISAGVGFVSLFGISVMSGVLLVSYLKSLSVENYDSFLEMVLHGSVVQFRPRFLVMLVAILGLIPAALNTGIGSDVQRPLATVIVGGLLFSLLLGVIFLPILYYLVFKTKDSSQDGL
jgi:cobalt-zinc-cadmium resistance protein CzcA